MPSFLNLMNMKQNLFNKIILFTLIGFLCGCSKESSSNKLLDIDIESYLDEMTIEEKVGQIFMVEISHITPGEVREFHIGAMLNGGGSFPRGRQDHTVEDWRTLADEYFISSKQGVNGKGIPVLWGTDAVHGHNNLKGSVLYPHNIGLGATRNIELIRDISSAIAKDVYLSGLDLTFAPAVSVPLDDRWGRTYEGFSEDPKLVAEMGRAAIEGYQGITNNVQDGKILATAKHFIGDGGTLNGVDKGNTVLSEKELVAIHGQGYFSAIENRGIVHDGQINALTGMDTMIENLDKNGAAPEYAIYANTAQNLRLDDMVAQGGGSSKAGIAGVTASYGAFQNSPDMAVQLGFSSFSRGGYTFHKHSWKLLNDPTLLASNDVASGLVAGVMCPLATVTDPTTGDRSPALELNYKAAGGYSRELEHWVTGSILGFRNATEDTAKFNYRSECALVTRAANQHVLIKA